MGENNFKSSNLSPRNVSSERLSFFSKFKANLVIWTILFGMISLSFLMSFHTLTDTDIFWHLKTGEIIFQTREVPRYDLFSFTVAGKEWIDAQWLFQLMIYMLFQQWGYGGLVWFGASIIGISWALLLIPGFNSSRYFLRLLLSLSALVVASDRFKLRPEILTFFYLTLELFLLDTFQHGKRLVLIFLPLVLLLWVNSEGLWPLYFVVLGTFFVEEIVYQLAGNGKKFFEKTESKREGTFFLGLCLLVSFPLVLVNPYGLEGALFPWRLFQEIAFSGSHLGRYITEFQNPFSSQFSWFVRSAYLVLIILSSLLVLFLLFQRRVYFSVFLLWLIFLALAFSAVRNMALFALVCAGPLARVFSKDDLGTLFPVKSVHYLGALRPLGAGLIFLGIILLMFSVVRGQFFIWNRSYVKFGTGVLETEYPIRAGKFLKAILPRSEAGGNFKIFSDLNLTGYLIWLGSPDWKVYFDPRLEVYGEEMMVRYLRCLNHYDFFKEESERYDFDLVVLGSYFAHKDLLLHLAQDSEWFLVYLDGVNVIFFRNKPEFFILRERFSFKEKRAIWGPLPAGVQGVFLIRERLSRGYLRLILGEAEGAKEEFLAGLKLEPEEPNLNYYLGLTFNQLGEPAQALFYLEKVAKKYPSSAKIKIQLARTYFLLGKSEQAILILKEVLQKEPTNLLACMDLAKIYEMLNREEANFQWRFCFRIYQGSPAQFKEEGVELFQALERMKNQNRE